MYIVYTDLQRIFQFYVICCFLSFNVESTAITHFFAVQSSGIRFDSNLYEYYSKGFLGALPDPSLIDMLIKQRPGDCDV